MNNGGWRKQVARTAGFTLIELLVVIVIIALLAAILFPVFQTAREKARQTTCTSNEKQISLGMLQYTQDFDDIPPCGPYFPVPTSTGGAYDGEGWIGEVYPYVKSTDVFHCPDDLGIVGSKLSAGQIWPSYRYNQNMVRINGTSGNTSEDLGLVSYTSPARTVMIYETTSTACNPLNDFNVSGVTTASPAGNGEWMGTTNYIVYPTGANMAPFFPMQKTNFASPMRRHSNGTNVICADGHVTWVSPELISFGYSNAKSSTYQQYMSGTDLIAEGADFTGVGAHILTMSIK